MDKEILNQAINYQAPIQSRYNSIIDDRNWKSNTEDIDDGDNFADYCKYIFKLYDEEEYDYGYEHD